MNIKNLIEQAKERSGLTYGQMADELGSRSSRISELKSGKWKPEPEEIAFFARKAQLRVLETLAEIEASINPRFADLWKEAVSEIRQNQGLSRLKKICRNVARKLQPKQRHKRKGRKGPFLLVK